MTRHAILLLTLLLAACATTQQSDSSLSSQLRWSERRELLANVLGFELQGRLADSKGRSGDLLWRQRPDEHFELQLRGPFGLGAISIEGDATGVWARSKDGDEFTHDPEDWMQRNLGWHLPLQDMRAWALGIPAAGLADRLVLDPQGRLSTLQQNGWTLTYDSYQDVGRFELPRKLEAESDAIHLKLIIDRWTAVDLAARG